MVPALILFCRDALSAFIGDGGVAAPCVLSFRQTPTRAALARFYGGGGGEAVGRVEDDALAGGEAAEDFGVDAVVVADVDFAELRVAGFDEEAHPVAAAAEEGAGRELQDVGGIPGDDARFDAVAVAELFLLRQVFVKAD